MHRYSINYIRDLIRRAREVRDELERRSSLRYFERYNLVSSLGYEASRVENLLNDLIYYSEGLEDLIRKAEEKLRSLEYMEE